MFGSDITPTEREYLFYGLEPDRDAEEYKRLFYSHSVWQAHRETLLAEFIRLHPGRRPFMWWMLEAPESRRRLSDREHEPAVFESEAAYLRRYNLLTSEELERLPDAAFRPTLR